MHPAVRDQTDQVQWTSRASGVVGRVAQRAIGKEFAGCNRLTDANDILANDIAGAQRQVADLGVAHLSVGQSYGCARRLQHGVRVAGEVGVEIGRLCLGDGVVSFARIDAEPVENEQDDGTARNA